MLEAPRRLGDTKPAGERKGDIPHEDHDVVHQDGRYRAEEAATTNMDTVTWLETVDQEQHNLPGELAEQCGVTLSNHLGYPLFPRLPLQTEVLPRTTSSETLQVSLSMSQIVLPVFRSHRIFKC